MTPDPDVVEEESPEPVVEETLEETPYEQTLEPPGAEDDDEELDAPEASAPGISAADPLDMLAHDPLYDGAVWESPRSRRGLVIAVAGLVVLAVAIAAWFVWLGHQRQTASLPQLQVNSDVPELKSSILAPVLTIQGASAAELDPAETPSEVATEPALPDEAPPAEDDAIVAAEPTAVVEEPAPAVEATPVEPVEPAPAETAPAGMTHVPVTSAGVGDLISISTATSTEECQVHMLWRTPGQSWHQLALNRTGGNHELSLSITEAMSPSFEYLLVMAGCGAAFWPADGSSQTVTVH